MEDYPLIFKHGHYFSKDSDQSRLKAFDDSDIWESKYWQNRYKDSPEHCILITSLKEDPFDNCLITMIATKVCPYSKQVFDCYWKIRPIDELTKEEQTQFSRVHKEIDEIDTKREIAEDIAHFNISKCLANLAGAANYTDIDADAMAGYVEFENLEPMEDPIMRFHNRPII